MSLSLNLQQLIGLKVKRWVADYIIIFFHNRTISCNYWYATNSTTNGLSFITIRLYCKCYVSLMSFFLS